MPAISGSGWEMLIEREREEMRGNRRRTVGSYKVFHNGREVSGLSGFVAESRGPGDNSVAQNGKRVEEGTYPLATQAGTKFVTIGFSGGSTKPRPGFELLKTENRSEILIHPGVNFLSSIGCINPNKGLATAASDMDFSESRKRTIALIDDMKSFLGADFPDRNGRKIPNAAVIIDGEPAPTSRGIVIAPPRRKTKGAKTKALMPKGIPGDPAKGIPKEVFLDFQSRPAAGSRREIYDGYVAAFTSAKGIETLAKFGVTKSYDRLMHFFAQAAHETGGFTLIRESLFYTTIGAVRGAWPTRTANKTDQFIKDNLLRKPEKLGDFAYGGRMGNEAGTLDGFRYRGGGTFQTTGKDAYKAKGILAGVDLGGKPELIDDPMISLLAACAEWKDSGCNGFADNGLIRKISRAINRGNANATSPANGEADRIVRHEKLFKAVRRAGLLG